MYVLCVRVQDWGHYCGCTTPCIEGAVWRSDVPLAPGRGDVLSSTALLFDSSGISF